MTLLSNGPNVKAGIDTILKFKLTDTTTGKTLTNLQTNHGKPLHFVVVDDSLTDFQHLHTAMADDGTWTQSVTFTSGGRYLLFADGKDRKCWVVRQAGINGGWIAAHKYRQFLGQHNEQGWGHWGNNS